MFTIKSQIVKLCNNILTFKESMTLFQVIRVIKFGTLELSLDINTYAVVMFSTKNVFILNLTNVCYIYSLGKAPRLLVDPAFDDYSSSLIKLNNGTILYLREVCNFLALVCILREDNFEKQSK